MYIASGQGQITPGVNCFQKCNSSVNLVICNKFKPFNYFHSFSHSNAQATKSDLAVK